MSLGSREPLDRIYLPDEVIDRTRLSRSTLARMVKRKEFPRPVQLSARRICWSAAAVDRWVAERLATAA